VRLNFMRVYERVESKKLKEKLIFVTGGEGGGFKGFGSATHPDTRVTAMRTSVTLAPVVGRAIAEVLLIGSHSYIARNFLPSIVSKTYRAGFVSFTLEESLCQ
jgi:hypothetical protein